MTEKQCPICGRSDCDVNLVNHKTSDSNNQPDLFYSGNCSSCGWVYVSMNIVKDKVQIGRIDKSELLGCLRRHSLIREQTGSSSIRPILTIDDLREGVYQPSTPLEQVNMLIEYIAFKQESLSEYVSFDSSKDYPICFAKNKSDCLYILNSAFELGYIKGSSKKAKIVETNIAGGLILIQDAIQLTLQGWEKVQRLREQSPYSKQVFVAFRFDKEGSMKVIYDTAIKPAISDCGLEPYATLTDDHSNSITDIIIAGIRKSRFIVADVTGASQNVYYEAGFAYGLGMPVILCCQEDSWKDDMKFDTSHIKHIIWKDAADLKVKLFNRIQAMGLSRKP